MTPLRVFVNGLHILDLKQRRCAEDKVSTEINSEKSSTSSRKWEYQLTSLRARATTAPLHLQINNQVQRLPHKALGIFGNDKISIQIEVDTGITSILIAQLGLDSVEVRWLWVIDVLGLVLAGAVIGVEADVSSALPLSKIDLRGPRVGSVQPESRPRSLVDGGDEVGREIETSRFLDGEFLLRVYRSGVVLVLRVSRVGCVQGQSAGG